VKTPTIVDIPLAAQVEAAEAQVRTLHERRAELQANLADLRDRRQAEMRRALGTGGTSPELTRIRAKIAEAEALVDQTDQLIADANGLVRELLEQADAVRTEQERATHAAEVARREASFDALLADLAATTQTADKAAGAVVVALGEMERLDRVAAASLLAKARQFDPHAELQAQGWRFVEIFGTAPFEWTLQAAVAEVAGLDPGPRSNVRHYLAVRDSAGTQQPRP
jgi:hypothetical protein